MKTGRMMTAAALMAAMATADTKATIERFAMMLQAGTFRSRGKGRGIHLADLRQDGREPQGLRLQRPRPEAAPAPDGPGRTAEAGMSKMVLLDGKLTPAESVTPDKARFIGTWRPPNNPVDEWLVTRVPPDMYFCTCGMGLWTHHHGDEHHRRGCFDLPQYVSLERAP